ncbi:MAG: helix-turn-helix domain-containing protein [Candidatus Magasanikbacteria bacterium]|nr:helix-turn-helix domain-containing protein [Candidatus Magasanikbacteria bacterium]
MNIFKELEKFNLTLAEAKVYVACLELGPESVQKIAGRAKQKRVSAYGLIKSLIDKGFLHEEFVKNKRCFAAFPPFKLYDIVSKHGEQVKREERALEFLVPELKEISKNPKPVKTNVIYYEGVEGLRNWASAVLDTKTEVLEWTKIEAFAKPFEDYLENFYFPQKFAKQIPTRFIFMDTSEARKYVEMKYIKNPKASPMKARFIDPKEFSSFAFMAIFDNSFSIALPEENRAVTVVDPLIAESQRRIFEFGWLHAKDEIKNKPYPPDQRNFKK